MFYIFTMVAIEKYIRELGDVMLDVTLEQYKDILIRLKFR